MTEKLLKKAYQDLPEPRETKGFSTEVFLYSLKEPKQASGTEASRKIERLCKKIEVTKRLVVEYSHDLSKTVDSTPVAPEYAAYFTLILLTLASKNNDLKYLNCALKLVDDCLQAPKFTLPKTVHEHACVLVERLLVTVRQYERS